MNTEHVEPAPAARIIEREIYLPDQQATEALAAALATLARPGDVIALHGDLGTGKTAFARAFVRARGGGEEVPSPTFTLVQTYDLPEGEIWHFDLYRLEAPDDALELDIEDAFADGISLIEWPERLGPYLPADRLDITFTFGKTDQARRVQVVAGNAWSGRIESVALND